MSVELSREQLLQKAIECFRKAGLPAKIAECYEEWPRYPQAAEIYEKECRDLTGAARCWANAREYKRAAQLYEKAGACEEAVKNWMKAGDFLAAGRICEHPLEDPARAAKTYEQGACWFEAARLWDRSLGNPERALDLYLKAVERLPPGPSPRRAEALLAAAYLCHAAGNERRREEFREQGERVAEQLAEAGKPADAGRAFEALGEFGVRAARGAQADTGYESALRSFRRANRVEEVQRVISAYLAYARSVGNVSLVQRLEREK